jgi:hypothetical protein
LHGCQIRKAAQQRYFPKLNPLLLAMHFIAAAIHTHRMCQALLKLRNIAAKCHNIAQQKDLLKPQHLTRLLLLLQQQRQQACAPGARCIRPHMHKQRVLSCSDSAPAGT